MKWILKILIGIVLVPHSLFAQDNTIKVLLKEGVNEEITYGNLKINALLTVYDKTAEVHLQGDISLNIQKENGESVVSFYVNNDSIQTEYNTKVVGEYLLTFIIENKNRYLGIAPIELGKTFALSSQNLAILHNELDSIEIKISEVIHEWGYEIPDSNGYSDFFSDIVYSLEVKTNTTFEELYFNSSELKKEYSLNLEQYRIIILSERYHDTYSEIEMKLIRKLRKNE
jgi:hypothetical protein